MTQDLQRLDMSDPKIRRLAQAAKNGNNPDFQEPTLSYKNSSYPASRTVQGSKRVNAQASDGVLWGAPDFFSPLHTIQSYQIASKRREVMNWCRFFYEQEPMIAAGVNFYSQFPINNFKLECKDNKIRKFFQREIERLDLLEWLGAISHEYFLLGDVFPFLEIDCPTCKNSGFKNDGTSCNHPDGKFKRIVILNPDHIAVQTSILDDSEDIYLTPDEELRTLVTRQYPKKVYQRMSPKLLDMISSGQPIKLSNRSVSHIKHGNSTYYPYGSPLIRRMFGPLAYKTKLMTANWIVADRMILPIRIVKLGSEDRPATEEDISDLSAQLNSISNDPNLTIVTQHNFEYDFIGATGSIHQITNELEEIGKEILNGFMINQSLLSGEMGAFSSVQIGAKVLIQRLEGWRNKLKNWVEKKIFLPLAMMQGFIDEEESKESGETIYLYPRLKWDDLGLEDNSNKLQFMMQLYDHELIAASTILSEMDIDYDTEIEKRRKEKVVTEESGLVVNPMGGGMGGPPPMGGMDMGGPPPMGDMGGPPIGGDMGGGMPPAQASNMQKIKKGSKKNNEQPQQTTRSITLTSLERKMLDLLTSVKIKYPLNVQYSVKMQNKSQPYLLDFAYPKLRLDIEVDGEKWHEDPKSKQRDMERDQDLTKNGWTVIRYKEDDIKNNIEMIKKEILEIISQLAKKAKK